MVGKTQNRGGDKERQPDPKEQRRYRHPRPTGQHPIFSFSGGLGLSFRFCGCSQSELGSFDFLLPKSLGHGPPAVALDSDRCEHALCRPNADLEDIA